MTGYGKAETTLAGKKYTIEIRSVNGKTADIGFKTSQVPREHELQLRKELTERLHRGNIDLFISVQQEQVVSENAFNPELIKKYFNDLKTIFKDMEQEVREEDLIAALLRMPEVREVQRKELDTKDWDRLVDTIGRAVDALDEFRLKEGEQLEKDLLSHLDLIEQYIQKIEALDPDRIVTVRKRLEEKIAEMSNEIVLDQNRLEQELIYYLEKADINEEQVRLKQHCTYFRLTMENEKFAGRKLNFITQEMGREINTLGSKAFHAQIQQFVVKMKDELEKIKEQVLNVL
jgi:uncharacterized protein (TIGR00255 family)